MMKGRMFCWGFRWLHVLEPGLTGFSRPMWVNPPLHKSISNDSVCFAAGDELNGAQSEFHFSLRPGRRVTERC